MANIITAGNSTNGGTAISTDTSGTLNIVTGSGSGANAITIDASQAVTMPGNLTVSGTLSASGGVSGGIRSGTAVASTSGTSIDFTSLPTGIKRITVMFQGVSTSGTSHQLIQIGSGSVTTSGYNSAGAACISGSTPLVAASTAGYLLVNDTATDVKNGLFTITLMGSNLYVSSHTMGGDSTRDTCAWGGGAVTLSGALDRVRITTVNGTDTFDAGSINILFE